KNCPPRLRKLLPPANFGAVANGSVYRSSYPMEENYAFLKSLKLKTIITLVPEECAPHYVKFMSESGINHVQVHIPANKGEVRIQISEMQKALKVVTDQSNWPILIHCNKGKHRTGCVVGCFRRLLGEGFNPIFEEYHTYADPKARIWDEAFMEKFDVEVIHQAEYQQKADPVSAPGDVVTLAVATQTPPPGWSARISKV
ncbi:protein-tyrosine phosphatase, partial [Amniculicola lignicola CBS 123094]